MPFGVIAGTFITIRVARGWAKSIRLNVMIIRMSARAGRQKELAHGPSVSWLPTTSGICWPLIPAHQANLATSYVPSYAVTGFA